MERVIKGYGKSPNKKIVKVMLPFARRNILYVDLAAENNENPDR